MEKREESGIWCADIAQRKEFGMSFVNADGFSVEEEFCILSILHVETPARMNLPFWPTNRLLLQPYKSGPSRSWINPRGVCYIVDVGVRTSCAFQVVAIIDCTRDSSA